MVERELVDALNDCIDRLAAGQMVDDCLRAYPQWAAELHPMLEAGLIAQRARYSSGEVDLVRMRIRPQIEGAVQDLRLPRRVIRPQFRLVAALAAVFTLVFIGAGVLAETSLPGDVFYGVKTTTENVRLFLTNNALQDTFAKRRLAEVRQLLDLNREAQVQFQGKLEAMAETTWMVSGLEVVITADTAGVDSVAVGDLIQVEAFTTADGRVVATDVQFISDLETEIPLPTMTVVPPVVTDTPLQTSTPVPSFTPSPTVSETPVFTPTVTNTAPITLIPLPTRTPTLEVAACTPSIPQGWVPYVVQPNDTLASLAAIIGSTADQLMTVNCIADPDNLEVGGIIYGPTYTTNDAAAQDTQAPAIQATQIENGQNSAPVVEDSDDSDGTSNDDSDDSRRHDTEDDDESKSEDESKDEDESESESEDESDSDSHSESES